MTLYIFGNNFDIAITQQKYPNYQIRPQIKRMFFCVFCGRGEGVGFTTRSRRKQKHVNNACYEYEMYAIALATATTAVTASSSACTSFHPNQQSVE